MQKGQIGILVLAGVVLVIVLIGGAYYLGRSTTLKPTPSPAVTSQTPQSSPSPSDASPAPTGTGETANWKTYVITNKVSFKYPPDLVLRSSINDVVKIGYSEESFGPRGDAIIIDARLVGVYTDYDRAIKIGTENLSSDTIIQKLSSGIKLSWDLAKIGQEWEGWYATLIYLKYKNGAITVQFNDKTDGPRLYEKITNTLKVLK